MASDLAEKDQAPYAHKDLVQHNSILWAQTIEVQHRPVLPWRSSVSQPTPSQTSVGCCLVGAQGGTEHVSTMEVDKTDYCQLEVLISDHPLVTTFL
jgi:hypothetical protein